MSYTPPDRILTNYAKLMVNFASRHGEGLQAEDKVWLRMSESAREFLPYMMKAILKVGAIPVVDYKPEGTAALRYERGDARQMEFFPSEVQIAYLHMCDQMIAVLSSDDLHELDHVPGEHRELWRPFSKKYWDTRSELEAKKLFFWTLCLYPTDAQAAEAGMTLEEYWDQVIKACYLDEDDPVAKWREINAETIRTAEWLTNLEIQTMHMKGEDCDITFTIGPDRRWEGGGGDNIPSFEIFTSPDWRGTNGWIRFNQPLLYNGTRIEGVRLEFENGVVTSATATQSEDALKAMLSVEGADKVGEVSLTSRSSQINRFMAETLYDENTGGEFGNTHLAVGFSFNEAYNGDPTQLTDELKAELGFNQSTVHTDIVSTSNRTVTATLQDGSEVVIYKDGEFQLD